MVIAELHLTHATGIGRALAVSREPSSRVQSLPKGPTMKRDKSDPLYYAWLHTEFEHIESGKHTALVRFRKRRGGIGSLIVPLSELAKPGLLSTKLDDLGWKAPPTPAARTNALHALRDAKPQRCRSVTSVAGWNGDNFVMPMRTFGPTAKSLRLDPEVIAKSSNSAFGAKGGTLKNWLKGLKAPCRRSRLLAFSIGVSFGAPLLKLLGDAEGALFHLRGAGTTGKSLAARGAQSVSARANPSDLETWDTTPTGLEELSRLMRDGVVILDESGRKDGDADSAAGTRRLVFQLISGRSRRRHSGTAAALNLTGEAWRNMAITTGELPLNANGQRRDGEQVRHIEIPVPPRKEGGIFLPSKNSRAPKNGELAKMVDVTLQANFGVAIRAFLAELVPDKAGYALQSEELVSDFTQRVCDVDDPLELRFGRKFGIVYAGMVLAARIGCAPWTEEAAFRHVRYVYKLAKSGFSNPARDADRVVQRLQEAVSAGTIPLLAKGDPVESYDADAFVGFRRIHSTLGDIIAVHPGWVRKICGSPEATNGALSGLRERGIIARKSEQLRVKGIPDKARVRWIIFHVAILPLQEDRTLAVAAE